MQILNKKNEKIRLSIFVIKSLKIINDSRLEQSKTKRTFQRQNENLRVKTNSN